MVYTLSFFVWLRLRRVIIKKGVRIIRYIGNLVRAVCKVKHVLEKKVMVFKSCDYTKRPKRKKVLYIKRG